MNPIQMLCDMLRWRKIISSNESYIQWLRSQGVRVGEQVTIADREHIIMDMTRPWLIEIGDNVEITARAIILTHGYDWCVIQKKEGYILGSAGKVKINNNVFIGANTTILPSTEIGENVIVGAGSVVKGHLDGDSIYAGVPAKKIMTLSAYIEKRKQAQLGEAVALVNEYKKVYGNEPPIEVMHEHFWLFSDKETPLIGDFSAKLALRGNYEKSRARLNANKPLFKDYAEFLYYCKKMEQSF